MRSLSLLLAPLALSLAVGTSACSNETKITGIEPNTGTFTGGEEVELKGQNFPRAGVLVRFGTKEAQPAVVESDRLIKVQTPAGDKNTNSDITVVFDDGRSFVLKNGFRYVDSTQQRQTMDKFFDKAAGSTKK
jgi:hypothetical protein